MGRMIPLIIWSVAAGAQTNEARLADEKTIRSLIQKEAKGERLPYSAYTDDVVYWTGAYRHPLEGRQEMESVRGKRQQTSDRSNEKRTRKVKRLLVAKSGDMAYEYTDYTLDFIDKSGKPVHVAGSYVRVWRKEDGQWKIAVLLGQPHE